MHGGMMAGLAGMAWANFITNNGALVENYCATFFGMAAAGIVTGGIANMADNLNAQPSEGGYLTGVFASAVATVAIALAVPHPAPPAQPESHTAVQPGVQTSKLQLPAGYSLA